MKYVFFFTMLLLYSCSNEKLGKSAIDGAYYVVSPIEEEGNVYVFSRDELNQFVDNSLINDENNDCRFYSYATFKYFITGDMIHTCLHGVQSCSDKSSYEPHFIIKSIDTIEDNNEIKQELILSRVNDKVDHILNRTLKYK